MKESLDRRAYEIRIWYSAEKGDECFVAQVVEWPGIMAHGDTREEAARQIQLALEGALEVAAERGIKPPAPALATRIVNDAVDVKCTDDELIVTLVDGRRVSAPLAWFPRLLRATAEQRANWRLIGSGMGIHWENVDEDISVRTLLAS